MEGQLEAIVIDVDGCLLSTNGDVSHDHYWGLERISAFVKKANQGAFPPISFCTGRDRNYVEAVAFSVGLPNFWSVIESGVAIFNPCTKELLLNPALTKEIKAAFEEVRERISQILEKYPALFLYPGNMINIALECKHGTTLPIEEAYELTRKELVDLLEGNLMRITHSDCAVDISPAGIDKASGLKFLSQHTGISLARALGIGDSNGDFPLFDQVRFVGCPANASDSCKERVQARKGFVSSYPHAGGVADIITHLVKEG